MAKLYFRYGAMNSGKSTALLQIAHNYEERGMRVLLIKSAIDTKADDRISSRIGTERQVDYVVAPTENLYRIVVVENEKAPLACVLIDEAQFLDPRQVDELMGVVLKADIPVICYGLRSDFQTRGFPGSDRLLQVAHSIEELKTICRCQRKAIFNGRTVNGAFVSEGEQVAIDGEVGYESLCGKCYLEKVGDFTGTSR
ncbi:thymidine kinase [Actinobaculum suis]|uniref:thymidine kinase n=1 Tax=Actinobaculum suis TaxID=1657 RepID=UPI00066FBA05|nr:thymidine kinase [Actinobaculum suis]KMY23858.1 thymidine kinase [Actinobaculum suis]OCA93076.1 thymidine kinase [Actinobaculum suis]OCA93508.1 thymidine kinase [Actinobaculum suis]